MEEQDVVKDQTAETTTATDSTPVEIDTSGSTNIETVDTQTEPAGAITEPEKKVSDIVPRDRLNEVIEERNRLRAELESRQGTTAPSMPDAGFDNAPSAFDPETAQALDAWYTRRREIEKGEEFKRRNADKLADPVLAGTVSHIILKENAAGRYIDQEEALKQAEAILDERSKPRVEAAKTQGVEEGQELALKKQQAGAVGDTTVAAPNVPDDKLSAEELRKKYSIPRDIELV